MLGGVGSDAILECIKKNLGQQLVKPHELRCEETGLLPMRKHKGADQLCSNCEADQRLCFHYTDSTIPLLPKSKISSF